MIEVISHPITLLCLGVIFVLCALLFFYFKRSMMVIEQAQMEQATVLRNFIASMEMRDHRAGNLFRSAPVVKPTQDVSSLIDVSDNEINSKKEGELEATDDNAYETETDTETESESDSNSEYSSTEALERNIIKVINVEIGRAHV